MATRLTDYERKSGSPFFAGIPEGADPGFEVDENGDRVKTYTWPKNAKFMPEVIVSVDYERKRVSARYGRTGRAFTLPLSRSDEAFDWARQRWEHVKMTS